MLIFYLIMFVFAIDSHTKFCLDLFSALVTGEKTAIATIPFTS